ncbi:MAG TPA: M42 family metallopeptidase [Firmicutes bacterium]|nr:M42 family metallopeptidase [Bacillota bacterium]
MKELLRELCGIPGPSGNEDCIREAIRKAVEGMADDLRTDALGNLILRKGSGDRKLMLAAHMDEIGLIVTHVEENGFLRFGTIGGIAPVALVGQRVQFLDGSLGVIGCEKVDDRKDLKQEHLFIDVRNGSNRRVGDVCCPVGGAEFDGDFVVSRALDDRVGCVVLIETLRRLCAEGFQGAEVYFVFTVQEELGLRGAHTATFGVKPDVGIAVDVTVAGDTPKAKSTSLRLGKGCAIKVKDHSVITTPAVRRKLQKIAEERGIPYQLEVLEQGGTDAGAIQLTCGGIPTGAVSVPVRYVHTPSETAHMGDVEACVNLLVQFIKEA